MSYTMTKVFKDGTDIGSSLCDLTNDQTVGGVKTFSANTTLKNITVIGAGDTTNYSGTIKCGAINCNGSITTNNNSLTCGTGAITCAGISCSTINTNSNTINCSGITCTTINTQNNTISCGTGSVTCGNLTVATSAAFSGSVTVPSVAISDNNTKAATTAQVKSYVDSAVSGLNIASYAPLNNPAFTGSVTVPSVAISDNNTKAATTAQVKSYVDSAVSGLSIANYAPLNNPAFTGNITCGATPTVKICAYNGFSSGATQNMINLQFCYYIGGVVTGSFNLTLPPLYTCTAGSLEISSVIPGGRGRFNGKWIFTRNRATSNNQSINKMYQWYDSNVPESDITCSIDNANTIKVNFTSVGVNDVRWIFGTIAGCDG